MKTVLIISLFAILLAFITGCVVRSWYNVKYISFNIPIGFFMMLGLFEYLFMFVSFFQLENKFYVYLFALYIVIICLLFILRINKIIPILKQESNNKLEILLAFSMTILFLFVFSKLSLNYMNEDIIYYNKLIYDKLQLNNITLPEGYYISQHYYSFFSSLISFVTTLLEDFMFVDYASLGYYLWIPTTVLFVIVPLQILDLKTILKKFFLKKYIILVLILLIIFVFADEWMFAGAMYGNTLRRFVLAMLILAIFHNQESKCFKSGFIVFILSGAMIATSSSSLFILFALILCYVFGNAFLNRNDYLDTVLLVAIPCLFTSYYIMRELTYLASIVVFLLFCLKIFKKLYIFEKMIRKYRYILICVIPAIFILIGFYGGIKTQTSFFNEMNIDNLRPHLNYINFDTNAILSIRNILFWIIVFIWLVKMIKTGRKGYIYFLVFIICLYNPFVYQGVSISLTKANYFRLNDLIYNIIFFAFCIFMFFRVKKGNNIILLIFILLFAFQLGTTVSWIKNRAINSNECSSLYKMPYKDIEVIEKLNKEYLIEDRAYIVGSHILGIEMYSNYKFINPLSRCPDPIQLSRVNKNQYDVIFYPQQYYQFEADYTYACAVAKQKNLEYFIENAQYDWMIEEFIWPCAIQQFELNNYRVWKMDYNLWNYNIENGLAPDSRKIPN